MIIVQSQIERPNAKKTNSDMETMPSEIIILIVKQIDVVESLLKMKMCCQFYNDLVSDFIIKKAVLSKKIFNYKPFIKDRLSTCSYSSCINADCFWDTIDIYEDIYHMGYHRYCHSTQEAENSSTMTINNKMYNVNTPYCCECFTNYILIGDNMNVRHNYKMDEINIDFL